MPLPSKGRHCFPFKEGKKSNHLIPPACVPSRKSKEGHSTAGVTPHSSRPWWDWDGEHQHPSLQLPRVLLPCLPTRVTATSCHTHGTHPLKGCCSREISPTSCFSPAAGEGKKQFHAHSNPPAWGILKLHPQGLILLCRQAPCCPGRGWC